MKRNLLKTMLVGIGLLAGTGMSWAEETTSTFTSSASAYVDATKGNESTNYNGTSVSSLSVSYTQFREGTSLPGSMKFYTDGKIALYKFDLTDIKAITGTITKATLKFTATSTSNCYNIRALGYNEEWDESTITYKTLTNKGGSSSSDISGDVNAAGSFQPLGTTSLYSCNNTTATLEADALTYLESAIEANKDYVSFAISMSLNRTFSVATSATLEIVSTTAEQTTYTVKFQDANGTTLKDDVSYDCSVGDEITASETDMADFYSSDGTKKYTYASGNSTTNAVSGGNTITLVFSELNAITVTVNAVDESGNSLQEGIGTATGFEGDNLIAYYSKYIKVNNQWYVTETKSTEPYLGIAASTTTEANVTYKSSDIAYFIEAEDMTTSSSNAWAASTDTPKRFSQGKGYRLYKNSYAYTDALTGGVYNLTIFSRHTKDTDQSLSLYVRASDGTLTDLGINYTTSNGTSEHDAGQVTIPDGYSLVIYNIDASYNSNVVLDYLYLTPVTEDVTVTSAGFATYCSTNALDFSSSTIKAYTASVSDGVATMTRVDQVPANTGVMLYSANGETTEAIPVIASATAVESNAFVGVTEATTIYATDASTSAKNYVLASQDGTVGFFRAASAGTTVPANRAYLQVAASQDNGAKSITISFGDDTNGISNIKTVNTKSDAVYNLNGQRVAQPQKGLYIVNGKKVILK